MSAASSPGTSRQDAFRRLLAERLFTGVCGMRLGAWLSLLAKHRCAADPPYWPRAAFMTGTSLVTSLWRWYKDRTHEARVMNTPIQAPLFILGHWRSGTTHLHNLLALDRRFAYPTAFQVLNPHTFLSTERFSRLVSFIAPTTRLVDNMRIGFEMPLEDEFAICVATFRSPYMSWVFPRDEDRYDRYLTFQGVPDDEIAEWKTALTRFLKKLTVRYDRPLLLKSPPHTCRIGLLLELFPNARFVHIYRNPYAVFQSTEHLHRFMYRASRLQRSDNQAVAERVLRQYQAMYERFFEERDLIPSGRFHELSFEELERDQVGQVSRIYQKLDIGGFESVRPALEQYVSSLASYRKNEYSDMVPSVRLRIARAWQRNFNEWGYAA